MKKIRIKISRNHLIELVVVFLGVTAGFVLNNWKISKQEHNLEQKYISAFLQDTEYNLDHIQKVTDADSIWLDQIKPVILSIKNKTITTESASTTVSQIVQISRLELRSGTYEDITNSGNFNLINDFQLKGQIIDFYVEVKEISFLDDYFYRFFNDMVMPFVFSEFSVVWGTLKNEEVIHSLEFSNVVAGYFSMVQQRYAHYKKLEETCFSLRESLIEKEAEN